LSEHPAPPSPPTSQPEARTPVRIRARGRSFLALVLSPERPLEDWLTGLDAQIARSAAFFAGKPVILDLGLLTPEDDGLSNLLPALLQRRIRVIGVEGASQDWAQLAGWEWPEGFDGGRVSGTVEIPDDGTPSAEPTPGTPSATLVVDRSVRSGQSIMHLEGDIVVIGGVSSGAEIVAGGSIHIYGPLRGRAVAGAGGHAEARIYTSDMRAELLAIDGYYMTAEEIAPDLHGTPAQAFLQEDSVAVKTLRPS